LANREAIDGAENIEVDPIGDDPRSEAAEEVTAADFAGEPLARGDDDQPRRRDLLQRPRLPLDDAEVTSRGSSERIAGHAPQFSAKRPQPPS